MSWDLEWKTIEIQIHEFDRLCASYIDTMGVKSTDPYGVVKKIMFPGNYSGCKRHAKDFEWIATVEPTGLPH